MPATHRLGLGTVQFGCAYGVSNASGQTPPEEAAAILHRATEAGIGWLDTARAYGTAEAVLGRLLPAHSPFRIVTKTAPYAGDRWEADSIATTLASVHQSLDDLQQPSVDSLLVHDVENLLIPGADRFWAALETLQAQGLVRRIGVSVYTETQLETVLARFPVALVQLPLNVFDQRFLSGGWLAELHRRGVAIHVRSVFLQGLLLMPPSAAPAYFDPLRDHLATWHAVAAELGPLPTALGFALAQPEPEVILVGVESAAHLAAIVAASTLKPSIDWSGLALSDARWINPATWHSDD